MVISRAAAAGDETVAVVKVAGGEVRFAEFEEYAGDGGAAKAVEGSLEEGGGDPPAAEIAMDGDIQDFRFAGGLAGGDETDGLAIAFNFANEDNAAGRVGWLGVASGWPLGGFRGVAQNLGDGRGVGCAEGTYFPSEGGWRLLFSGHGRMGPSRKVRRRIDGRNWRRGIRRR